MHEETIDGEQPSRKTNQTSLTLVLSRTFRKRLGDISRPTFQRLEREDPAFPAGIWLRGQRAWLLEDVDLYIHKKARGSGEAT